MHQPASPNTLLERTIVWIGAAALVLLGGLICLSVGLRMAGAVVKGSAEIGEMLIIIVSATAIVTATFTDAHPSVHMLVEKLGKTARTRLAAVIGIVGAVFWAATAWINGKVAIENAGLIEETELLRISVIPFRWLWIACLALVAIVLVVQVLRSMKSGAQS